MANNQNMVYLYKGDEKYLTNTKISNVIKESKADDINITSYDCSEVNVENAVMDALMPAFLGGNKVVLITSPVFLESEKQGSNHNLKRLMEYVDNPMDTTYFIINASGMKVNEKLEITKYLMKKAKVVNTNGISEVEFSGWLERECAIQNIEIEKSAIALMYKSFGSNLEQAKNEIDKIIAYIDFKGKITETIMKELISRGNNNVIYELISAIFSGNKKKAVEIYLDLTKYEKDVSIFINMITKSFKDSLLVKTMVTKGMDQNIIAAKMHVSTNRAYYMIQDSKKFSTQTLEKHINELAILDYKIKSGNIDKKIGFEQFLFGM